MAQMISGARDFRLYYLNEDGSQGGRIPIAGDDALISAAETQVRLVVYAEDDGQQTVMAINYVRSQAGLEAIKPVNPSPVRLSTGKQGTRLEFDMVPYEAQQMAKELAQYLRCANAPSP